MAQPTPMVSLNGVAGDITILGDWVRALMNPAVLREKGGYLFKASFADRQAFFAVAPYVLDGQRSYHFAMQIEQDDAHTLIGVVDANGAFGFTFKPDQPEITTAYRLSCLATCRRFARVLIDAGYRGDGVLDDVTKGQLAGWGGHSAPDSLAALAAD